MLKSIILATAIAATVTPASAFIDLGFVNGYEARIREFSDPAQSIDYWYASTTFHIPGSFEHAFSGTEYWLTLASDLGLALYTPPHEYHPGGGGMTPGVPEPATWAMMLLGFLGLVAAFRQRRRMVSA